MELSDNQHKAMIFIGVLAALAFVGTLVLSGPGSLLPQAQGKTVSPDACVRYENTITLANTAYTKGVQDGLAVAVCILNGGTQEACNQQSIMAIPCLDCGGEKE